MTARVGVITFPGTLDDVDAARAVKLAGAEAVNLWHADADLKGVDAVVVPGGFSYGDYLRCGAIAGRAAAMDAVRAHAARGGLVLGICNGFQILCESGLLPGVLMRNVNRRFICHRQFLRVERADHLPRLGRADQRARLAGLQRQAEVIEHTFARIIFKNDVPELNAPM